MYVPGTEDAKINPPRFSGALHLRKAKSFRRSHTSEGSLLSGLEPQISGCKASHCVSQQRDPLRSEACQSSPGPETSRPAFRKKGSGAVMKEPDVGSGHTSSPGRALSCVWVARPRLWLALLWAASRRTDSLPKVQLRLTDQEGIHTCISINHTEVWFTYDKNAYTWCSWMTFHKRIRWWNP